MNDRRLRTFGKKAALVLAGIALLAVLVGLYALVKNWRATSTGAAAFQLAYEHELAAHLTRMDRAYQGFPVDWLLLGDSQLQALPSAFLNGSVANFAIGGQTMARLADRMDRYTLLAAARTIVLAAGANDLREGKSADSVAHAWRRAVERIPPGPTLICLGLFPRRAWQADEYGRRVALNQRIATTCAARGGRFIDPYSLLAGGDRRLRAEFDDGDGIHLTGDAYRLLAEALIRPAGPAGSTF